MKIKRGKCVACGKEGIESIKFKGMPDYKKMDRIMDKEHTLTHYGGKYRCCNIWCYLKARAIKNQMTLEGEKA